MIYEVTLKDGSVEFLDTKQLEELASENDCYIMRVDEVYDDEEFDDSDLLHYTYCCF